MGCKSNFDLVTMPFSFVNNEDIDFKGAPVWTIVIEETRVNIIVSVVYENTITEIF